MAASNRMDHIRFILGWLLIVGYKQKVDATLNGSLSTKIICNHMQGLVGKQRDICYMRPDAIVAIAKGARQAVQECQRQFEKSRWNCSLGEHTTNLQLGNNLHLGSKEAGFSVSIKSAGIAYSITHSCSLGLLKSCACDRTIKEDRATTSSDWEWGGCSANVEYGIYFAQIFLTAADDGDTPRSLMNLHNSRTGRKILRKQAAIDCKCHGSSGSCTLKTCWKRLPNIHSVGDKLMKRYHKAKKVFPVQLQKRRKPSFKVYRAKRDNVGPKKVDLVFLEDSPNYCEYNKTLGSLGTRGRACNKTISKDADSCDILCCGRGYNIQELIRVSRCRCIFHWCCHVTCEECKEVSYIYTCK